MFRRSITSAQSNIDSSVSKVPRADRLIKFDSLSNGDECRSSSFSNQRQSFRKLARECTRYLVSKNSEKHPISEEVITETDQNNFLSDSVHDYSKFPVINMANMSLEGTSMRVNFEKSNLNNEEAEKFEMNRKALRILNPNFENPSITQKIVENCLKGDEYLESDNRRRVILLFNFSQLNGYKNLLSQVSGGPLEKIVCGGSNGDGRIELHFIYPEDARKFLKFSHSIGVQQLNGQNVSVNWAKKSILDGNSILNQPISPYLLAEIQKFGARRCLLFSQEVPQKTPRNSKSMYYPSPRSHFSSLDIVDIKRDFSKFGTILDIYSVLSKKLCFCLSFADIRSAIVAKKEYDARGTLINIKYGNWDICYGKDNADIPCLHY